MEKKDEDEARPNPFLGLERSSVLQEARTVFNAMPLRPRECVHILTKLLFLLYQGENIGSTEATETFFAITKLFQNGDVTLRKMMHLTIKEMAGLSENVIIVTSSLTKDMTGKVDAYRATAIRALTRITDSQSIQQIERYLKQAIVDRNPQVQSAALVSSLHLAKQNYDVVKRWNNEAQQALNSRSPMAQYHALGLLHHIKHRDRLAVSKLVTSQMNSALMRSPYAACLLIRYATQVMQEDPDQGADRKLFDFLESCLRNKSEIVIYEAARAIVNMTNVTPRELSPAVAVLQLFLGSPKQTMRFAAVRTLNKIAMTHPACLKACNLDLENLINDPNRSIATLAITTLLKTGSEASIDRLMQQISSFMSEISDEFKTVVVDAIKALCLKFPKKHHTMLAFLSNILRDEGGFEYKRSIVDTIVSVVENVPESTEAGLANLCEFIEDCEFPSLLTRILFLLGKQGPRTPHPSKYIRFIYNRVILENELVRAAAIVALAKFGVQCPDLRPSVIVLLRRCLSDPDDEVRDRATFYLDLLEKQPEVTASKFTTNALPVSLPGLERALLEYVRNSTEQPFDIKTVPIEVPKQTEVAAAAEVSVGGGSGGKAAPAQRDVYSEQLAAIPEFAHFGPLFKSSDSASLTEAELEYIVKYVKHIFASHCVFQFNLTNTVNDQQLENIRVVVEPVDGDVDESSIVTVPCPLLAYGTPSSAYVAIPLDPSNPSQSFTARMEYVVKDCDPETGEPDEEGYADTYNLEDIELSLADMMQGVNKPNFAAAWDQLADQFEMEETFGLESMSSLEEAVEKITGFLGMEPCERSHKVKADTSSHTLYLAGIYIGGHDVLARARLALDEGVTLHLAVRSSDEETCQLVGSSIG